MKCTFKVEDIDGNTSSVQVNAADALQAELLVQQEISGWIKTERTLDARATIKPDYVLFGGTL